jgi:hypothetical protein
MDLCVPDMAYGINTKLSRRTKLLAKDPVESSGFAAMHMEGKSIVSSKDVTGLGIKTTSTSAKPITRVELSQWLMQ